MKSIIVRMRGGLGNQLFILAFAFYLFDHNNDSTIVLDDREYNYYKIRKFELIDFVGNDSIRMYEDSRDKSMYYEISRTCYHLFQRFLPPNKKMNSLLRKNGLFYSKRSAETNPLALRCKNYVYGYFQDVRVAKYEKKRISDMISSIHVSYDNLHNTKPVIAISIRGGEDYRRLGLPICDNSYFKKGLEYINKQRNYCENYDIFVFADDMEYAKKYDLGHNAIYVENLSPMEQLRVMMDCNDYIISNSSFSWWGAFLGCKSSSVVVMPEYWYNTNSMTKDTLLLYDNCVIF